MYEQLERRGTGQNRYNDVILKAVAPVTSSPSNDSAVTARCEFSSALPKAVHTYMGKRARAYKLTVAIPTGVTVGIWPSHCLLQH